MAEKTIDEMRAELEASGYELHFVSNHIRHVSFARSPQGTMFYSDVNIPLEELFYESDSQKNDLTQKAYAHLQTQKELAELRAFVKGIASHKDHEPRKLYPYNIEAQTAHECNMLYEHVVKARDLVREFGHEEEAS